MPNFDFIQPIVRLAKAIIVQKNAHTQTLGLPIQTKNEPQQIELVFLQPNFANLIRNSIS